MLKKEAGIFIFNDLLEYFPFRHIDKTQVTPINRIGTDTDYVLVSGKIISVEIFGEKRSRRLVATLYDGTGELELVWFQGINWMEKTLNIGTRFRVFGKAGFFMNSPQITHPEMEMITSGDEEAKSFLEPVYPSTEKLKARSLGGRQIAKLTSALLQMINVKDLPESLPETVVNKYRLVSRYEAFCRIHFPSNQDEYIAAVKRLKFEELFISQLRLGLLRFRRHSFSRGLIFKSVGNNFNEFISNEINVLDVSWPFGKLECSGENNGLFCCVRWL